mmetsp:Transcript_16068/g.24295  ORF Transcript_16068/g.24295 Transcript_16068/m.24295 type:complete len:108 (-) Transcript_16068:67-390(-)
MKASSDPPLSGCVSRLRLRYALFRSFSENPGFSPSSRIASDLVITAKHEQGRNQITNKELMINCIKLNLMMMECKYDRYGNDNYSASIGTVDSVFLKQVFLELSFDD